ncbi:MAG: aspartate-semialdehyde dehydrogenase [Planctomycetes bacterium]|nr:aspartate-semialdehyde dehydrogenase [Planctomycetota bacterium]
MESSSESRLPVSLYGATGVVGQRFLALLSDHPWFELVDVRSSSESAGQTLRQRLGDGSPESLQDLVLGDISGAPSCRLVFSALSPDVAGEREAALRDAGHLVVTNASPHRMDEDVPLIVPEVNPGHLELISDPSAGAILANPNCSTTGIVLALAPFWEAFGVEAVHAVTLQALSGMGAQAPSLEEFAGKLSPSIPGEEEKIEAETCRILGALEGGKVRPAQLSVAATTNRVAVLDGHTACVSLALAEEVSREELLSAWAGFSGAPQELELPSAPEEPIVWLEGEDAPRPDLHVDRERGMAITVARLRECPVLDWRFTTLSHNAVRGAAGGALLLAELAMARGFLR